MAQPKVIQYLRNNLKEQAQFTTQDLISLLSKFYPEATNKTHSWRINKMKNEGLIHQIGRGLYSFEGKPEYLPTISLKTKRFYNRILPSVSDMDIFVWESQMLFDILDKVSDKHFIFFHVKRSKLEKLHQELTGYSKQSFLNPGNEIIKNYILPLNEAIVLLPSTTQTPIIEINELKTLTIEGLLLNAHLCDSILAQLGVDMQQLFSVAFNKYKVNVSRLMRYASRRDKKTEIEKILNTII